MTPTENTWSCDDITSHRQILRHFVSPEKRRDIVSYLWDHYEDDPEAHGRLCALLAGIIHQRPEAVKKFPKYKKVELTFKHLEHQALEATWAEILEYYCDMALCDHDACSLWDLIGEAISDASNDPEQHLHKAEKFADKEDIILCLGALFLSGPEPSEALRDCLLSRLPPRDLPDASEDQGQGNEPDPQNQDEFTTMDNLLIRQIVDSVTGVPGALSEDEAVDAVEELISLNSSRHRSYFHRGYHQALLGKAVSFESGELNASRRAWLIAGQVMGLARNYDQEALCALYSDPKIKGVVEEALSFANSKEARSAARMVSEKFFDALWKNERKQEAAEILRGWLLADRPRFMKRVVQEAANCLRQPDVPRAKLLVDVVEEAWELLAFRPDVRRQHLRSGLWFEIVRRRAQCLAAEGHFEESRQKLTTLIEKCERAESPLVLTDLGLVSGNFKRIADVLLPANESDCAGVISRINRGIDFFRRALNFPSDDQRVADKTNAHYVFGTLALLERRWADACGHLLSAYSGASKHRDKYERAELYQRIQVYYALAILCASDEAQARLAVDLLEDAKTAYSPGWCPDWLLKLAMDYVKFDVGESGSILKWIIEHRPNLVEEVLHDEALLFKSEPLQQELQTRIQTPGMRSIDTRWADGLAWLNLAIAKKQETEASDALDALEGMALDSPHLRESYIQFVSDPKNTSAVWSWIDATISSCLVLQAGGCDGELVEPLIDVFSQYLSQDPDDAEGILERLEAISPEDPRVKDARARFERRTPSRLETADPDLLWKQQRQEAFKLLFVGGNEMQKKYDSKICAALQASYPWLEVDFRHTGWGGGWGSEFEKIKKIIPDYDCVVIMRFIRTQLGRSIRKACGEQNTRWFACTGHGEQFIRRTIERAVRLTLTPEN